MRHRGRDGCTAVFTAGAGGGKYALDELEDEKDADVVNFENSNLRERLATPTPSWRRV